MEEIVQKLKDRYGLNLHVGLEGSSTWKVYIIKEEAVLIFESASRGEIEAYLGGILDGLEHMGA